MSDAELVEKYRRLCGYIARHFVAKGANDQEHLNSRLLGPHDAEDMASVALISLVKCPAAHRHEKPYVNRLIVNAIIKEWHKKLRLVAKEAAMGLPGQDNGTDGMSDDGTLVDVLNSRQRCHKGSDDFWGAADGLPGRTQIKFDSEKAVNALNCLPDSERIVLSLNFGLNGCQPSGEERIAKKLGRTRYWVTIRLSKGLERLREQMSA